MGKVLELCVLPVLFVALAFAPIQEGIADSKDCNSGDGVVTLKVFNLLGGEVATLINENRMAGKYQFKWQPSNLASGIYFYRLQARGNIKTRKLILLQ